MYRVISWVYTVDKDSTNFRGSQNKTPFYRYQSQSKVSAIVADIFFLQKLKISQGGKNRGSILHRDWC